jgi:hypothetical protein
VSAVEPAGIPAAQPAVSDEIAKRLLEHRDTLKADAEHINDELERIDAQLIEWVGGQVGTHDVAGRKVEIREYSRTDTKAIELDYPAAEYPALYAQSLSTDAVKREFAPAALEGYKVRGKKSVIVK